MAVMVGPQPWGENTLIGTAFADDITAPGWSNLVDGGAGNDVITGSGSPGSSTFIGGAGDDLIFHDAGGNNRFWANGKGLGVETIYGFGDALVFSGVTFGECLSAPGTPACAWRGRPRGLPCGPR
ncbi:MAG: hypothetical protein N3D18_03890 [Roseococcus sp.]|nr:hypothetical protein [Roseococcus sp.]